MRPSLTGCLVNLTPHPIRVLTPDGELFVAGPPARRTEHVREESRLEVNGRPVPVLRLGYGAVLDLPEPEPGTWYVVSRVVADALPERGDLLVPAQLIRDADGNPVGCRAFVRGAAGGIG
ncbi:hypothetical protein ABT009_30250 [Streptomyces sp. NPDC002896]|uniref:hypothetical protein n=1 Tax=Streptomyces sp. NPDC002896 TaxID=3154438 RepID=UPI00331ADB15